jgi:5-methylcytosine-specific restriction endonuclease McrA
MPYVNKPRPYKHEWELEQKRNEKKPRAARARARYKLDKEGVDRAGKDIDHIKPLSKGGTNSSSNLRVVDPSKNRSYSRNSDHTVKVNKPKKK